MVPVERLFEYIDSQKQQAKELLAELISFPSTYGEEGPIQQYIFSRLEKLGVKTELVPIDNSIKQDPEYSFSDEDIDYRDRPNVVATVAGDGGGRSLILNCHSDVVPGGDWPDAFTPRVDGDIVLGRGACDDKGQIVVLYLVLAALQAMDVRLGGDVTVQIVIEEEVGGNGSLALIRSGYKADGAIVLESTELKIHPANRGAVWFKVTAEGKSVHMGQISKGVSAIEQMIEVIKLLKDYEKRLIRESQGQELFKMYKQPVMVNVGTMQAGDWPATVPGKAVIEGSVGFLPNKTLEQVKSELKQVITESGNDWLRKHCLVEFDRLHNEAFETPAEHPLVRTFQQACEEMDLPSDVSGFIISCDGRLFNKVGGMPTVVFGAGSLSYAHSNNEQIDANDIIKAAKTLMLFMNNWCNG